MSVIATETAYDDDMQINFTKVEATGNDFVMVMDPDGQLHELAPHHVAQLCDRHLGIGADGFIRALRTETGEWFMDYRNADGSAAEMCGNGVRAFTHFLLRQGAVSLDEVGTFELETRAGMKQVRRLGDGFEVDLGPWRLAGSEPLVHAHGLAVARPGLGINVGNPHVVVALASRDELEQLELAITPSLDPEPVNGANIEFVVPGEPLIQDEAGHVQMRVYERGVGETLSCGTGAAATALAVRHWAGEGAPRLWNVTVPGGVLTVRIDEDARGEEHVYLGGPARTVFEGMISL